MLFITLNWNSLDLVSIDVWNISFRALHMSCSVKLYLFCKRKLLTGVAYFASISIL